MFSVSKKVQRKKEILGPETDLEKISWCLALVRGVRHGQSRLVQRAVAAYQVLQDFFSTASWRWLDRSGLHQHLATLYSSHYERLEAEVQQERVPFSVRDGRSARIRDLAGLCLGPVAQAYHTTNSY